MSGIQDIKVDLEELKRDKEQNFRERLAFVDWWVEYMKNKSDKEWSEEQNRVINPQMKR